MTPAERKSLRAPRPLSKAMVQRIADRAEHKPVSRNRRLMCYKSPGVEDGKSAVRPLSPEGLATALRYQAGPDLSSLAARPAARLACNYAPVSYTHLDVYKRQG